MSRRCCTVLFLAVAACGGSSVGGIDGGDATVSDSGGVDGAPPPIADPRADGGGPLMPANCPNGESSCLTGGCEGKCAEPTCDGSVCVPPCHMDCTGGNCALVCSQKATCTMD